MGMRPSFKGMTGPEVIGNGKDISSRDGPTFFNGKAETCNHKDAALVPAQVFFDDVLLNTRWADYSRRVIV